MTEEEVGKTIGAEGGTEGTGQGPGTGPGLVVGGEGRPAIGLWKGRLGRLKVDPETDPGPRIGSGGPREGTRLNLLLGREEGTAPSRHGETETTPNHRGPAPKEGQEASPGLGPDLEATLVSAIKNFQNESP